jgi:acyl-CoA thioester hydrolase
MDNFPKNSPELSVYKKTPYGKCLMYNHGMKEFKFFIPITVRYGDIDAQWHVNHTRSLTYMEQARFEYYKRLDLFDGKSFLDLRGIIVDIHVTYLAPIFLGQNIRVGTRATRIGNKSITFEYLIEDADSGKALSKGEVVIVTYDYRKQKSIPVPDDWRKKISDFEERSFE